MTESSSAKALNSNVNYPIFSNPEHFLKLRKGKWPFSMFKSWSEQKAIKKCIGHLQSIKSICDTPCGPGRLFNFWKQCEYKVQGVELSDDFIPAARHQHQALNLDGEIIQGDAFYLEKSLEQKVDCVISVRFLYYFNKATRIELLQSLAKASNKYLLVQYKSLETYKGRKKHQAALKKNSHKRFLSHEAMRQEVEEAGLKCLKVVPIGNLSDRVFVVCSVC
jgi:hypothetical protein